MRSENQFISDYSINLADTASFTPILAIVGILSLCICGWGYYITSPLEYKETHQFITLPQSTQSQNPLGNSIDLHTYAKDLHFPNFDAFLSCNLYTHTYAPNILGSEREHNFCDLTVHKTITSHVEYLRSQLIVNDLDPDCVNAWESNTIAQLRQPQIQINTHPEGETVLWAAESIKSPICQSLLNYTKQIEAFSVDITQMYITLTHKTTPLLEWTTRPNSLKELSENVTRSIADDPQKYINTWGDVTSVQDAMLQIELFSGLEPYVLVPLFTSVTLLRAMYSLNLTGLPHLEIKALNHLVSCFKALLGCVHPALLEAFLINPIFINRKFSEELEKLSIFHKTRKRKPHAYRLISVWALFNIAYFASDLCVFL